MSEEQLVRMGRTDLYRRGDTEIKDGRRVAKPGTKPVTMLTTSLRGSYACAYQHSGQVVKVTYNGQYLVNFSDHDYDLVAIDPAPKIEPWEWEEIPAGHWFRWKGNPVSFPCEAVDDSDGTIRIDGDWMSVHELLENYEHCPTHCGTFEPCGKTI